jgi:hypothetical protein
MHLDQLHVCLCAWCVNDLWFDSDLFCYVRSTARHAIHFQFDVSANVLEIRAVQSPICCAKSDVTPV